MDKPENVAVQHSHRSATCPDSSAGAYRGITLGRVFFEKPSTIRLSPAFSTHTNSTGYFIALTTMLVIYLPFTGSPYWRSSSTLASLKPAFLMLAK
jgi:hypothetical protein